MRTLLELQDETERCRKEFQREDLIEPWARAFIAGAIQMGDWMLGQNHRSWIQRPSEVTGEQLNDKA